MEDPALAALYAAPLEEFTRRRDALARALRAAGEPEAAKALAGLRKPTVVAWGLNQLALRVPEELARLFAAGQRLREAGDPAELRAASAEQRRQVEQLATRVQAFLEEAGHAASPQQLEEAREALRASAAAEEEDRRRLQRGRLERPLAPVGFGGLVASRLEAPRAEAPKQGRAPKPTPEPKPPRAALRAEREREAAAKEAQAAAERARTLSLEAERALKDAEAAERAARAALERAKRKEREAAEARARREATARRLEEAEREAQRAHK